MVVADDLRVRANPGLDAVELACEGALESRVRLATGDVVWITDDESQVQDGYLWYQVVAPDHGCTGSELALVAGWVAAGPVDDPRWIERFDEECPEPSTATDLPASPLVRLACYGAQTLTLHGIRPNPPEGGIGFTCPGIEPQWLTCGLDTLGPTTDSDPAFVIRIPPGVEASAYGSVVVIGAFDDSRAEDCSEPANRFSNLVVQIYCRTQFVVQSMAADA